MMTQFYISRHAGGVVYLCLRDINHPWYGEVIQRMDQYFRRSK
jgi:hypothetical protein